MAERTRNKITTMTQAEQFIQEYTRNCSNECWDARAGYIPWLTPEQARKAVEVARKELIDKACEWMKSYRQHTPDGTGYIAGIVNDKTIEDFRRAMEE